MLTDVLSTKEKAFFYTLIFVWFGSTIVFWMWWFEPQHIGSIFGFILTSIVVAWPMILFGYCFFFLVQMKKTRDDYPVPTNLRVAMVITKAPSEPFSLVQKTLQAALLQEYPHDTWVADEDPSDEALEWYRQGGVKVSCRKNDTAYHNDTWPRRKKCKEGNLAYFYEKFGYEKYDVVVHMDADHQPQENYLEEILKPFTDESVGYVAAPSVCDLNIDNSWAARARMQSEALFHGPIQSGSNTGYVPLCIGSHYAVRTKALQEIGGIGPELAEDYSTTLLFNASKWRGVWVYDAEARGEGPNSFADIIIQDYQWARSLITLLLTLYPKLWKKLNWRQRLHFTFTQQWYGLSAFVWFAGLLTIVLALFTGQSPVVMNFFDFLEFALIPYSLVFIIFTIVQRKGHMRPSTANFFNWENIFFELARWPWICVACIDAVFSVVTSKKHTFTVTSKNKASSEMMPLMVLVPYLLTAAVLIIAIVFRKQTDGTAGYLIFALIIASCYLILSLAVLILHIKEISHPNKLRLAVDHTPHFISSLGLLSLMVVGIVGFKFYDNTYAVKADEFVSSSTEIVPTQEYTTRVADADSVSINEKGDMATSPASQTFSEYTVKSGDTLRHISFEYFGNDMDWVYIKREGTGDPNLISVGEIVLIPNNI